MCSKLNLKYDGHDNELETLSPIDAAIIRSDIGNIYIFLELLRNRGILVGHRGVDSSERRESENGCVSIQARKAQDKDTQRNNNTV